jgi:predicted lipoprotein with Yx(FWY)xxD motif
MKEHDMKTIRAIGATVTLASLFLTASVAGTVAAPNNNATATVLVKVVKTGSFGNVLANGYNQVFYNWDREKSGQVKCTGACAVVWPPVIVGKSVVAPAKISGTSGTFTIVTRPDGTHQLAFNHRPLYRYVDDVKPLQVLCDGVDGWHVVRIVAGH